MGGKENGRAAVAQLAQDIFDQARRLGVEADGRLIQEENFGIMDQGAGDGDLLLHAVAVAFQQVGGGIGELEQAQQFAGAVFGAVLRHAVQARHELEELPAGQFAVQVGGVGHIAEGGLGGWMGSF